VQVLPQTLTILQGRSLKCAPLPPFIFDKKWETNKWTVGTLAVPNAQRIGVIDTPDLLEISFKR
jgi:hypothetical protein